MKAMILAAGKGERMRPLTDITPKPLLKVNGQPLIQYTIDRLKKAGYTDLVVNAAYLGEQVENFLGDGSVLGVQVQISREQEPLETGGGIANALPLLAINGQQPFLLVNSDVWTDVDFGHLKKSLQGNKLAHLVLVKNPEHNLAGDFLFKDGLALPSRGEGPHYTYSGISVLHPKLFELYAPKKNKFPLLPLLLKAMEKELVSAEVHVGTWVDVGTPERLKQLNQP